MTSPDPFAPWIQTDLAVYNDWDAATRRDNAYRNGKDAVDLITSGAVNPFDHPVLVETAFDYLCAISMRDCEALSKWLYGHLDITDLQEALGRSETRDDDWAYFYLEHYLGPTGPAPDQLEAAAAGTIGLTFILVGTRSGTLVPVPEGWPYRVSDNGRGIVYQMPGAVDDAYQVRIMPPNRRNPSGYVVITDALGRPINPATGKPGAPSETHIPSNYRGPINWPDF
jgi:hypothetical protein